MSGALDARARRQALLLLLVLAAALRLGHVRVVLDSAMSRYHDTFTESDMHLLDVWARHIVSSGDWLGRETFHPLARWQLDTASEGQWREWYGPAPVFYKAPFYAYALALARRLWGDPMVPLAVAQVLAGLLSVALLFALTERLFGSAAAVAAALLLALYAPDIHYAAVLLRGPWIVLTGLLVTWQLGRVLDAPGARRALGLGAVAGLSLLVNEGFAVVVPLMLMLLAWQVRGLRRLAVTAGACLAGLGASLAPLVARNLAVGAPPFKLAVTGGIVYAVFNAAGASPFFFEVRPAVFAPILAQAGSGMGATMLACLRSWSSLHALVSFYALKSLGLVVPFENPDNANFYYAALRDPLLALLPGYALLFPAAAVGLALARRRLRELAVLAPVGLALVAAMLVALPLSRYRAPLAVLLMPLAGLALARTVAWARARRWAALAAVLGAGALLALATAQLQARVVFARTPPASFIYRGAEFWLESRHALAQRRPGAAAAVLEELARLNPNRAVGVTALARAAQIRAATGDPGGARRDAGAAEQVAGDDPALLATVGDVLADSLGDAPAAGRVWRRALEHAPPPELGAALQQRLRALAPPAPVG